MKKLSPVSIDDTNSHCSVPCFAHFVVPPRAAYLKTAQEVDARGIAIFSFPPEFEEGIENLFYQEWDRQTLGFYELSHEAVFTTLNSVNRRLGESLEMLVPTSDDADFVAHGSVPYEQSITAFAFSKPSGAGGKTKSSDGKQAASPRRKSTNPSKAYTPTDTAWKGIWQGIMNIHSGYDRKNPMPTLDELADKLTLFHQHVKNEDFKLNLSKAPCLKVLDIPQYKEKLASDTADCIDVEVADWLQELQPPILVVRGRNGGGNGAKKQKRGEPRISGDPIDEDALDEIPLQSLFDLSAGVSTMAKEFNGLAAKVRFLDTVSKKTGTTMAERKEEVDGRLFLLEKSWDRVSVLEQRAPLFDTAHTTAEMNSLKEQLASAKAQLDSAHAHAQQNQIVFGSLATTLQLTRVLLNEKSAPDERAMHDLLSAPLFSQIINMVNNLWGWTTAQKISIYGAFLHIPAFKTEYDKLI